MKIIHGSGYSNNEARNFIPCIHQNIIYSASIICKIMKAKYEDIEDGEQLKNILVIFQMNF